MNRSDTGASHGTGSCVSEHHVACRTCDCSGAAASRDLHEWLSVVSVYLQSYVAPASLQPSPDEPVHAAYGVYGLRRRQQGRQSKVSSFTRIVLATMSNPTVLWSI